VDAAQLELLTAPAGRALLARLRHDDARDDTPGDTPDELRVARRLRREHPAELVTAALALRALRRRAAAKFSRAQAMYFTRDGLEQATAEPIARHRARRYARFDQVADLCCGIGGDLVALAGAATTVLAVDHDPLHLRMAQLNAEAYGVAGAVRAVRADARHVDLAGMSAAFVDPARRSGGRRLRPGDGEPPLHWCLALAAAVPAVGIKTAPGLDRARVPNGWEAQFVADRRELKEAVLWSPPLAGAPSRATVLPGGHELLPEPGEPIACRKPGQYLLDPNPAVARAGLIAELARRLDAWQIDPMIAFLSADRPLRSPFGRSLRVIDSAPWREKELPGRLRAHDIGPLDIRRRGLAGDVDALRRRLRPTGSTPGVLVMTRVSDRPWALLCLEHAPG